MKIGYSQRELSNKLGKPVTFVFKIETGIRRIDPCELIELCRVLEIDYCTFMSQVAAFNEPEALKKLRKRE